MTYVFARVLARVVARDLWFVAEPQERVRFGLKAALEIREGWENSVHVSSLGTSVIPEFHLAAHILLHKKLESSLECIIQAAFISEG